MACLVKVFFLTGGASGLLRAGRRPSGRIGGTVWRQEANFIALPAIMLGRILIEKICLYVCPGHTRRRPLIAHCQMSCGYCLTLRQELAACWGASGAADATFVTLHARALQYSSDIVSQSFWVPWCQHMPTTKLPMNNCSSFTLGLYSIEASLSHRAFGYHGVRTSDAKLVILGTRALQNRSVIVSQSFRPP